MCGIAGAIWGDDSAPLTHEVLGRMTSVLAHRGPDGEGQHYELLDDGSGVALGHRRLSIIDVAGGRQPISNEDESVWITFNGEIYNYRELRTQLEQSGHIFRTNSDTETIVHLYEEKGIDCLQDLRGMFAFAIWDRTQRRLFLARDRMGQKPLVYREEAGRLLFASEVKAILQAPGVPREINRAALDEFLTYSYVPHPRTMFAGIHKLPPAHYAVFQSGKFHVARYWDVDFNVKSGLSGPEIEEQLGSVLLEAVRLRLRSDVPLGAFLSGGIDSTVIAGLMQRLASQPTNTFTIGFEYAGFDETNDARSIANHLQTNHHEFKVRPDSLAVLPKLTWHFDEPFGDSSSIPTYYVSQIAREQVKVALTGDGGDELFGGYVRYQTVAQMGDFERWPKVLLRLFANPLWNMLPAPNREMSYLRKLRERVKVFRQPSETRYVNFVSLFNTRRRQSMYSREFTKQLQYDGAVEFFAEAIAKCSRRCAGSQAMLADLQTYLPGDLLVKVDIASMAHGLECRSPFLDHRVVELAAAIPYGRKVRGTDTKHILKNTFRTLIPPQIAKRRKMGFSLPIGHWFRKELRELLRDQLLNSKSLSRGYFEPNAIRQLINEHMSEAWDHSHRLWALLCLELWHQAFIDPASPPRSASEISMRTA